VLPPSYFRHATMAPIVSLARARPAPAAARAAAPPAARLVSAPRRRARAAAAARGDAPEPLSIHAPINNNALFALSASTAPWLLDAGAAHAIGREYGVVEGQLASLAHPAAMFFLFGASVWAGYLGFQWREARALGEAVRALKAQRPAAPAGAAAAPPPPPSALDAEIRELEAKRKGILAAKPAEQHSNWGHLLLGLGVLFAVAGPVNTFLRTGKLFPGPHLWAGAAIVVLWAGATALVPAMQKGNETARSAHIAMNAVNVALFAWQIPTGLEIVAKVFEFTTLP
jgi:hypothetical protein